MVLREYTIISRCDVFLCYNLFSSSLYVCLFLKKEEDNCLILLKRVCCVQYNLFYSPLKVTVAFEWSYSIPLCQNLFSSLLCVCFVSRRKKNAQLKAIDNHIINFSQDLRNNTNVLKNQRSVFISRSKVYPHQQGPKFSKIVIIYIQKKLIFMVAVFKIIFDTLVQK